MKNRKEGIKPLFIILGDGSDWINAMFYSVQEDDDVEIVNSAIPCKNMSLITEMICKIHFSRRLNSKYIIPKKNIWYNVFPFVKRNDEEKIYIIHSRNVLAFDDDFLSHIRRNEPNSKLVFWLTASVKNNWTSQKECADNLAFAKKKYDLVTTYIPSESQKYSLCYIDAPHCKIPVFEKKIPSSDVYFIGKAKLDKSNRYKKIINLFESLHAEGLRLDFNIVDVPKEMRVFDNSIKYNTEITYEENIEHIMASKCILEIGENDNSGVSLRFKESCLYGKLLITNISSSIRHPLYNANNMMVIDDLYNSQEIAKFIRNKKFNIGGDIECISPRTFFFELKKQLK